jgi:hypothetical protein
VLIPVIQVHQQQRIALRDLVQVYVRDTSVALADRWEIFTLADRAHILGNHTWIQHLSTLDGLDVSWYDDFYKERYTDVRWIDIIEQIREDTQFDEELLAEDPNAFLEDAEPGVSRFYPHLDQIKEEILAAGFGGFTLDW